MAPTLRAIKRIAVPIAVKAIAALSLVTVALPNAHAQSSFDYPNFASTTGLNLNGASTLVGETLRLTTSGQRAVIGSAVYNVAQNFTQGFETSFAFQITDPRGIVDIDGNNGGDDITLAFVSEPTANVSGNTNFAIALNTFHSARTLGTFHRIISGNSISFIVNSSLEANLDLTPLGINLSDGLVHLAVVNYNGDEITTTIDGTTIFVRDGVDLTAFSDYYISLGSYVGDASENHDILSWSFQSFSTAAPEPGSLALLGLVGVPMAAGVVRRRKA